MWRPDGPETDRSRAYSDDEKPRQMGGQPRFRGQSSGSLSCSPRKTRLGTSLILAKRTDWNGSVANDLPYSLGTPTSSPSRLSTWRRTEAGPRSRRRQRIRSCRAGPQGPLEGQCSPSGLDDAALRASKKPPPARNLRHSQTTTHLDARTIPDRAARFGVSFRCFTVREIHGGLMEKVDPVRRATPADRNRQPASD